MGATLTQAIKTYSLAPAPSKIPDDLSGGNGDTTLLQQIVALVNAGAVALAARQYRVAIADYRAAESLIYTQIDPQWDPNVGSISGVELPRDPALFTSLLSSSSQWLNILSVPTPASPVRSLQPAVALPLATAQLHGAGLVPPAANPTATAQAVSDIRLATIYAAQGNTAGSQAASARAAGEDPATAAELAKATGLRTTPIRAREPAERPDAELGRPAGATDAAAPEASVSVLTEFPASVLTQRQAGIVTGVSPKYSVMPLEWPAASVPDIGSITSYLYEPHAAASSLPDAVMIGSGLVQYALSIPYYYFYVIPVGLGQAYQGLGDSQSAISQYLAAAQYTYINTAIEGPYLWVQLATCYLAAGDVYYQQGDTTDALAQYSNVLLLQGADPAAPATSLYTLSSLATATAIAKQLIPQLPALAQSGTGNVGADDTLIATVLLQVFGRLNQLNGSLDFWGNYAPSVPIWTFDYLQQVAINFAQLAVQSEQQVINYWTQAQQAQLTAAQLQSQAAQTNAQAAAATLAAAQAQAQANAYAAAYNLAAETAADAQQNATQYATMNSLSLEYQAWSQLIASGEEKSPSNSPGYPTTPQQLESRASNWNTLWPAYQIGDQWQAGVYSQTYQTDSLQRTAAEAQAAEAQAQLELDAARAQVLVANANVTVAQLQANGAAQALQVFDADTFTPLVWLSMGNFMLTIYQGYMSMALAAAKLMEKAYNFENDTTVTYIQNSYSGVVDGLLGADALMADIQEFTYDLATTTRGKLQLVKTSISLATNYGYLFNTQLIPTGSMSFQTSLDDFDSQYPGTYQGRIKSVNVQFQGIVPASGVSGTLTNGGISWYRLPADIATDSASSKMRIQSADTLVISDYDPSQDGVLDSSDGPQLGIFEGAGVASTWALSIPPSLNDIDYGSLTDVILTFLYEVRFDPQLVPTVLRDLASRPGWYSRQRAIPLAWLYPDLFYAFGSSGTLTLSLGAGDFPFYQTSPVVTDVAVLLSSATAASAAGVTISLCPPGKTAATAVTSAAGSASSQDDASWTGLDGGSALGDWVIAIDAADNPALVSNGQLDLSAFSNMTLMFDYTFTPRG
jgi:hypothetical protein